MVVRFRDRDSKGFYNMAGISDQAIVWMVAIGTSSAIFGGGGFVVLKAAKRGHAYHTVRPGDGDNPDAHTAQSGHGEKDGDSRGGHSESHWTYAESAKDGPEHWGDLSDSFSACEKGTSQSPVDIRNTVLKASAPEIEFHYKQAKVTVENNGHTIVAKMPDSTNHITINDEKFTLLQFHFHNPSEHLIDGQAAEMELHLVHKNDKGNLAVIGIMLDEDGKRDNVLLQPIWNSFTHSQKSVDQKGPAIELAKILPKGRDFFHYPGSLTTPPCTEGVKWFVMKNAMTVGKRQVDLYAKTFGGPTNRPVQPIHDREITEGSGGVPMAH
jgi:carbonic anhydrase